MTGGVQSKQRGVVVVSRYRSLVVLTVVIVVVAAACGNSSSSGSSSTTEKPSGSSSTVKSGDNGPRHRLRGSRTRRSGWVASPRSTNPLGVTAGSAFDGAKAYFDKVNADGGIYGRKITLVAQRDDKLSSNSDEVQRAARPGQRLRRPPRRRPVVHRGRPTREGQRAHVRLEHQRRVGRDAGATRRPTCSVSPARSCASAAPLPNGPYLAKLAGKHKLGAAGLQRSAVRRAASTG